MRGLPYKVQSERGERGEVIGGNTHEHAKCECVRAGEGEHVHVLSYSYSSAIPLHTTYNNVQQRLRHGHAAYLLVGPRDTELNEPLRLHHVLERPGVLRVAVEDRDQSLGVRLHGLQKHVAVRVPSEQTEVDEGTARGTARERRLRVSGGG